MRISKRLAWPAWAGLLTVLLSIFQPGCRIEKPDPAAQVLSILHKHPADFLDQLSALDALSSREAGIPTVSLPEELFPIAKKLKPLLASARTDSARAVLLTAWVFDTLGVRPDLESNNLEGSLPSQVLLRKRGSCVGISLLFLALGRVLDIPVKPVFLPGHLFVRFRSGNFARNIETLRPGIIRTDSFYRDTFHLAQRRWYDLSDREPVQALAALTFNLANFHAGRSQWDFALVEYSSAESLLPGYPDAVGSQGAALFALGRTPEAEAKLRAALDGDSLCKPAWRNLAQLYRKNGDSTNYHWAESRSP